MTSDAMEPAVTSGWRSRLAALLFRDVSVLSQSVLRAAFGCFVMWQAYNKGIRVFSGYRVEGFDFSYPYFSWIPEFPEHAQLLAIVWFISGFLLFVGFLHRISSAFCFLISAYAYLIPAELYLNHEYMELIFLFLMCFGPAGQRLSIDSLIWNYSGKAANFHLLVLKLQVEIILIYAGLVKLNSDWLHLQPLSNWLRNSSDEVFFGWIWHQTWAVAVGAHGIIALHVLGAPLLLFKKTRMPIFLVYTVFHLINAQIFSIDIFPFMTIACSTLFFEPDWPNRFWRRLSSIVGRSAAASDGERPSLLAIGSVSATQSALVAFFAFWLVTQLLIPIRHVFYPGWVDWNDAGTRFSWRMMLAQRTCPVFRLVISDPQKQKVLIPDLDFVLNSRKVPFYNLCVDGDLILQTAHQVRDYYARAGLVAKDAEIRAHIIRSLNYRKPSPMVEPTFDLGKQRPQLLFHYEWLTSGKELPELPAPFESHLKGYQAPDLVVTGFATGFNLVTDYNCEFKRVPKREDGNDLHCTRKR